MVSIEILRQVSCFDGLEQDQLSAIARLTEMRSLAKDAFLFREGDRAEALYILVSGSLLVSRDDSRGRKLQLATLDPGACLGEMGLTQGAPRSADVSAKVESVVLCFYRN